MKKSIITIAAAFAAIVVMSINVFAQNHTAQGQSNWTVQVERPIAIAAPNNTVFLGTIAPGTDRDIAEAEKGIASHIFEISGADGAQYTISGATTGDLTNGGVTLSDLVWEKPDGNGGWNIIGTPGGGAINGQTGVFGDDGLYSNWVTNGVNSFFKNTIGSNMPKAIYRVFPSNIAAQNWVGTGMVTFTVELTATYTDM